MTYLSPLYGGGPLVAYAQLCVFYYLAAVLIHSVVPSLIPVKSVQQEKRHSVSVRRDALYSLGKGMVAPGGPCAVLNCCWSSCLHAVVMHAAMHRLTWL
jgi:hypothetical protein